MALATKMAVLSINDENNDSGEWGLNEAEESIMVANFDVLAMNKTFDSDISISLRPTEEYPRSANSLRDVDGSMFQSCHINYHPNY